MGSNDSRVWGDVYGVFSVDSWGYKIIFILVYIYMSISICSRSKNSKNNGSRHQNRKNNSDGGFRFLITGDELVFSLSFWTCF